VRSAETGKWKSETGKAKLEASRSRAVPRHSRAKPALSLPKRGNPLCFALLVAVTLLLARPASAQVATGLPPFGSFGGGTFDTVNNANLDVHFQIPVISKAGRGLPFVYALTYDSLIWTPVGSSGSQVWTPVTGWFSSTPNWGWSPSAGTFGVIGNYDTYQYCYQNGNPIPIPYVNYEYWDPTGALHTFPFQLTPGQSTCGVAPVTSGSGTTNDGSGYTMVVDQWAPTVYSPSGVAYNGSSLTDTNGNQISSTTSSGTTTYTDTLGTAELTISGSGTPSSPIELTYTPPSGTPVAVKINYVSKTVQTNFACTGVTEFGPTSENLVSSIVLPDGTSYTFTYETTPLYPNSVTGRIASVTLPTGGKISYSYSGNANDGVWCGDGTTAALGRTTPDGAWTYTHSESGTAWTTTITDPQSNVTTLNFQGNYETERQVAGLETIYTCYNGASFPCNSTSVSLPITQRAVTTSIGGLESQVNIDYNSYGLVTEVDEYDYGSGAVGSLLRKMVTAYNTSLNNCINNRPSTVQVENALGTALSTTSLSYDQTSPAQTSGTPQHVSVTGSRGNPTTVSYTGQSMGTLTRTYSYFDTGLVNVATDVNSAQTSYLYNSTGCPNSFPTTVNLPQSLSVTMTWNCTGGVMTGETDVRGLPTTYTYTDNYYWRPASIMDTTGATTDFTYVTDPFAIESTLDFNGTTSTVDVRTTLDGLGRTRITQRQQGQGSANYDSVETYYDALGRPYEVSVPYSAAAGVGYSGSTFTTTTYDAMSRPTLVTDGDGGALGYTYSGNDVLVTIGPAPSGENAKKRQLEYSGLGQLTSVCEVTSSSGSGNCAQNTAKTGYWTKYTYDVLNDLLSVTQNAQSSSTQSRSYSYDGLRRLLSETNPESGTTTYVYDSSSCSSTSYNGDLVKRTDAVGNVSCYTYDGLHRRTTATYPSGSYASVTPAKTFVYDSATVNGAVMAYTAGRLAEAYTGTASSKITDLGFSYWKGGEVEIAYELTPNSGGYYQAASLYWPNGLANTLSLLNSNGTVSFIPQITYTPDGEGRVNTVSAASGQNPVTGTTYPSPWGLPTAVNFGSQDSDAFTYDQNTGRMKHYQFTVNGSSVTGALTWNQNRTLQQLAITDPFNSSNQQTCNYLYDDLARIASVNCGSIWSQTFGLDPFGNLTKSGTISFQPTYNPSTNQVSKVGGIQPSYDANGNLTNDGVQTYAWDTDGNSITVGAVGLTFDALDRMVEQNRSGSYTQIVYGPSGSKLALMNGQTLSKAFVPLSGGATAVYTSSGLAYYRHSDWLGSSRLASTTSRTVYYDGAYAPYGENYAEMGTQDRDLTGQNQDTISSGSYPLYDFLYREHHPTWGRWLSPDRAGHAPVDPEDPQTWNRYAYLRNSPTASIDLAGLTAASCSDPWYAEGHADCGDPLGNGVAGWGGQGAGPGVNGVDWGAGWGPPPTLLMGTEAAQIAAEEEARFDSIIATGWDPVLGVQYTYTLYWFTDKNGNVISNQKTLAAIAFGQEACSGMDASDVASCIQQTYDTMGDPDPKNFEGGHENYDWINIRINIDGEPIDTDPSDFSGCLGGRCGVFNSLDFSHPGTLFHVDMANVYFFPVGTIIHGVGDFLGGHTWWSGGVPPFPFP